MPKITHVCISDLHFGEEDSILTNLQSQGGQKDFGPQIDPLEPSPVLENLSTCLQAILSDKKSKKPALILNGDILELALCEMHQASMAFERFYEIVMKKGNKELFSKIIYIPGNHDHHIWEGAREWQYAEYIKRKSRNKKKKSEVWASTLSEPYHVTPTFLDNTENPVRSHFLTSLISRYNPKNDIQIVYPSFGLHDKKRGRVIIFDHGHYVESLYHFMTDLKKDIFSRETSPTKIGDIEKENFAWVDFLWSTLGRSGQVGRNVEAIYEMMLFDETKEKLKTKVSKIIAKKLGFRVLNWIMSWIIKLVINYFLKRASGMEKVGSKEMLSKEAREGLLKYISGPITNRIEEEIKSDKYDLTFVMGHTHKPFEELITIPGKEKKVKVFNTGGWVVESDRPNKYHGASIVFIDEELNTASVRVYDEANPELGNQVFTVNGDDNRLRKYIEERLSKNKEAFEKLGLSINDALKKRRDNLSNRVTTMQKEFEDTIVF